MSDFNKFPTDFIPVSRPLAKKVGYQAAYVFGVVWNYCQMEDGVCRASYETIADRADISRRSVIRHIDELIKAGYIEDLTPDVKNAPHHFCTKKGVTKLHSLEAERGEEVAPQDEKGVTKLHPGSDKIAPPGVTKLHPNRKNQKTELIEIPNGSGKPPEDPEKWNNANKKIVGDKFLELTHLKPPPAKSKTAGAWWGWLFEIFEMAGRDSAEACRIMGIVVKYMRARHTDITSPKSLISYSRVVASGQELNGVYKNGTQDQPRASPGPWAPVDWDKVKRLQEEEK